MAQKSASVLDERRAEQNSVELEEEMEKEEKSGREEESSSRTLSRVRCVVIDCRSAAKLAEVARL